MNKSNFDKRVLEFLTPEPKLDLKALLEMVEEVMDSTSALLQERETSAKAPVTKTYNISQVPMIPVSELGWANNEDGAEGGSQRKTLEDWLKPIGSSGDDFQSKIQAVVDKMNVGFTPSDHGGNMRKYIQEVMSYLVFLKSLTMAITNFNASAAGFNFEAFLSVLMGGSQIPAGQTGDVSTIADFVAQLGGETVPVSLKLYGKGSLKTGGSFTDLCHDLTGQSARSGDWASWASQQSGGGGMRYLVCDKAFQEAVDKEGNQLGPLSRSGNIRFHEFDITVGNLFAMFQKTSDKTRNCVGSDSYFMTRLKAWDDAGRREPAPTLGTRDEAGSFVPLPDKQSVGNAEQLALSTDPNDPGFLWYLQTVAVPDQKLESMGDAAPDLMKSLAAAYAIYVEENPNQANQFFDTANNIDSVVLKWAGWDGKEDTATAVADAFKKEYKISIPALRKTTNPKGALFVAFSKFNNDVLRKQDPRGQALQSLDWQFNETIVGWYEGLSDEAKKIAILNSKGYIGRAKWEIPDGPSRTLGKGLIATLPIGAPHVQGMLDKIQDEVMQEVFAIFDEMATMSEKLNSYFANGLKETSKEAEQGAEAGEAAAEKARKVAAV